MNHPGYARQRGELIRRSLGLRTRELRQQRRLTHGWKTDERDATVTVLDDVESLTRASRGFGWIQKLGSEFGELRFKDAEMSFRRLILLRATHLQLDVFDLF